MKRKLSVWRASPGACALLLLGAFGASAQQGPVAGSRVTASEGYPALEGVVLVAEPFVGRFLLDRGARLDRELDVLGGRLGLDWGPVGLRGYYWRETGSEPAQSAGAFFRLAPVRWYLTPYLVFGASAFRPPAFQDPGGQERRADDEPAVVLGGGLQIRVSERIRLGAQAADHMISRDTSGLFSGDADGLSHNWLVTAGLAFAFGGQAPERPVTVVPPPGRGPVGRAPVEGGSREAAPVPSARRDTVLDYAGDRVIQVPLPREGAVYLRYGPGAESLGPATGSDAGIAAGQGLQDAVRAALAQELRGVAPRGEAAGSADLELLELRLTARLEQVVRELLDRHQEELRSLVRQEIEAAERTAGAARQEEIRSAVAAALREQLPALTALAEPVIVSAAGDTFVLVQRPPPPPPIPEQPLLDWVPADVRVYSGMNVNTPRQGLFGLRADFGRLTRAVPIHLVPELALGVGEAGASYMLAANGQYLLPTLSPTRGLMLEPRISLGLGVLWLTDAPASRPRQEGVLNLGYGIAGDLSNLFGTSGSYELEGFLEHQGVDLFDLHRLLLGVRWVF